jgi:hypothetical protein
LPLRLPANGEATATVRARAGISAVLLVASELSLRAREKGARGNRYGFGTGPGTAMLEGLVIHSRAAPNSW